MKEPFSPYVVKRECQTVEYYFLGRQFQPANRQRGERSSAKKALLRTDHRSQGKNTSSGSFRDLTAAGPDHGQNVQMGLGRLRKPKTRYWATTKAPHQLRNKAVTTRHTLTQVITRSNRRLEGGWAYLPGQGQKARVPAELKPETPRNRPVHRSQGRKNESKRQETAGARSPRKKARAETSARQPPLWKPRSLRTHSRMKPREEKKRTNQS